MGSFLYTEAEWVYFGETMGWRALQEMSVVQKLLNAHVCTHAHVCVCMHMYAQNKQCTYLVIPSEAHLPLSFIAVMFWTCL